MISFGNHIWGSKSFLFFLFDLIMNEENKMTKLAALGEQARPQPIRQGSQPAGKKRVTNVREQPQKTSGSPAAYLQPCCISAVLLQICSPAAYLQSCCISAVTPYGRIPHWERTLAGYIVSARNLPSAPSGTSAPSRAKRAVWSQRERKRQAWRCSGSEACCFGLSWDRVSRPGHPN